MIDELKPVRCGCGGEAEIFHIAPEGYAGSYCVRCVNCLTQTPFFTGNKEKAIEVWNKAMGADTNSVVSVFSSEIQDFRITERTAKVIEHDGVVTMDGRKYHHMEYFCDDCKKKVLGGDDYCSHCGARLDWSGNE